MTPSETPKRYWTKWLGCLATIAILVSLVLFAIFVLFPAMQYSREAARCAVCRNKMKQIGIALQKYHDEHGLFPPAYTVDAEGNPLHSWRTLILPYFEEPKWKEIYDQIRFDEPWDSEHNRQFNEYVEHATEEDRRKYHSHDPDHDIDYGFHHNMPAVYGCPNHSSGSEVVETVYKMVVGDNAIGNARGTSKTQITRPLDKTILVIEAGLSVPWMSPVDFTVEDFKNAVYINDSKAREIRKVHNELEYEWITDHIEVIDGTEVHHVRRKTPEDYQNELAKCQILGGHWRQLHVLFADGTVKIYWDYKLPLSEIETMSRVRE